MRFRTKLFLAILLPPIVLLSLAVAAALQVIRRESEESVQEAFQLAGDSIDRILGDYRKRLRDEDLFRSVRLRAVVKEAYDTKDYVRLRQDVESELDTRQTGLDYVALVREDAELWYRRSSGHACVAACDHRKELDWITTAEENMLEVAGGAVLARRRAYDEEGGFLVLGRDFRKDLHGVAEALKVDVALQSGSTLVYRTRPGWPVERTLEGEVTLDGERFLGGRRRLSDLGAELVLLRSMSRAEAKRRDALSWGTGAMAVAVLVAGLASSLIARGTSKPIERLVEVTRKVAEGDYTATSGVAGRDELGRLGAAFDEMTEGLRKRREIMEKTLSRDVAEQLMKGMELGGEAREVTIVFMDIRGFTSGTQGVDPAEVVTMLNDMMDQLTAAIHRHGGNVNKYLGDGLMAMFGAPKPLEDHALHAARAGLEMQKALASWNESRVTRGLPNFHTGIGINTGIVVCGQVGSKERLEYTLIGEEVNLASRICGKALPRQVLATKATFDRCQGRVGGRELEPVQVKGISYPVKVYEVTG